MILLPGCLCCHKPKRYTCVAGECVEDPYGEYDEPTCGGNCQEECECPDWCLYKIEIVSPVALGPGPRIPCGGDLSKDFELSLYPPCEDEAGCCGPVMGATGFPDRVYATIGLGYARVSYTSKLAAGADADVTLRCVAGPGNVRKIYADITYGLDVPGMDGLVPRFPTRGLVKTASIKLDSECLEGVGITCSKPFDEISRLALLSGPLEFTVNAASAGLGAWDTEHDDAVGDQTRITPCFDHLVDNFEVKFRVTQRDNCEPPPDPCTVLVDGVRVPVSSFNPYEVITAKWRGLSAPGRNLVLVDGVVIQDIDGGSYDGITDITTAGCDAPSQTDDVKAVYIATGGSGIVNACATGESIAKYQPLVCEVVDENTARLYGGVSTVKLYTPCDIGGAPSGDDIQEESQWLWECLLVDGVPGAVTVSPLVGARYFNKDPVVCGVTHEPPVVTLDFVP